MRRQNNYCYFSPHTFIYSIKLNNLTLFFYFFLILSQTSISKEKTLKDQTPHHSHPDHYKFIVGIQNNDRIVLEEIYKENLSPNVNWVKRNGGTQEDGYDNFQDAIEIIVRKAYYTPFILPCPFKLYLGGVCRNLWFKKLSKKKREKEMVRNLEIEEHIDKDLIEKLIEETIDGDRWLALLERTFAQLSELCQRVLSLYQKGELAKQIAAILKMEPNAVYRRRHACLSSWKKAILNDSDFKNCNPYNL